MDGDATLDPMRETVVRVLRDNPDATFQQVLDDWARIRGRPATSPQVDRLWGIYNELSSTVARTETALPVVPSAAATDEPPGIESLRARIADAPLRPVESAGRSLPPVAPWARRIAALFVDGLVLGIVGQVIALPFAEVLFGLGPYGRAIGFPIMWLYFGVLGSRIANGQTLGKRLLGIAVRGEDGLPIGPGRSLARSLLITVPLISIGAAVPGVTARDPLWVLVAAFGFCLGLGGLVFIIVNRHTHQALHDYICRTRVVRLSGSTVRSHPGVGGRRLMVSLGLVPLVFIAYSLVGLLLPSVLGGTFGALQDLQRELADDPRLFTVEATLETAVGPGQAMRILVVDAWYRGLPSPEQRDVLTAELVTKVIAHPIIDEVDAVRVQITSAYDIGIAKGNVSWSELVPVAGGAPSTGG